MPSADQLRYAEEVTQRYRTQYQNKMQLIFVVPDYYEARPKACMNGWGSVFLTVAPDGLALPCHSARDLPISFPNVKTTALKDIWYGADGFNHYRGDEWMAEPCRTCPEKEKDFGGCRCQAYLLTGQAENADPVCDKSPHHHVIQTAVMQAQNRERDVRPLLFRNTKHSNQLARRGC